MNGFTVMRSTADLGSVSAELGLVVRPFGSEAMARANMLVGGWMDDAGMDVRQRPAGGLSGGLWAYCGAELVEGARFVLDAVAFDKRLQCADAAVSGEGRLDTPTLTGKAWPKSRAGAAPRAARFTSSPDQSRWPPEIDALLLASVGQSTTLAELERAGAELALTMREVR